MRKLPLETFFEAPDCCKIHHLPLSSSYLDRDGCSGAITTVFASFVCPLLCVLRSVGFAWSFPLYYPASFCFGGPIFSCPPRCFVWLFLKWCCVGWCTPKRGGHFRGRLLFHRQQQGLLLSSKRIHFLSHLFVRCKKCGWLISWL